MDTPSLSIEDIARRYNVSAAAVHGWITRGKLTGYKLGGTWRVKESDVAAFEAAGRTVKGQTRACSQKDER